jgi:hypothetical protein
MKNLIFFKKKCIFFLHAQKNHRKTGRIPVAKKINNMKHKTAAKVNKKPSTPQGYGGEKL